ncbi:glycerophosphodiester phosphodiesterase [Streptacidiphilus sp. MAP5-3]|uniref:glycerophosphodiester phosphodiesterase n=1 Tax=unclassified Streptacidiphilus TaxID=2643834 RepID=UPI003513BAC4
MLVVGHRGAPRVARENTLASIRAALELGADWIEVDVRVARCGTPVLLHDATLERLWGDRRPVGALDAEELARLGGGGVEGGGGGVPTLRAGVEPARAAGVTVMVDVPGPAEGAASLALLRGIGALDAVVFAGDRAALGLIRDAAPDARIALSWESPLLPRQRILDRIRPEFLNVEQHRVTPALVRAAHRRGLRVSVWTVDRPARMARLAARGVDVLITNDPAAARTVIPSVSG